MSADRRFTPPILTRNYHRVVRLLSSAFARFFSGHGAKRRPWDEFAKRVTLESDPPTLATVVARLAEFLMPPTEAAAGDERFERRWSPCGPWSPDERPRFLSPV